MVRIEQFLAGRRYIYTKFLYIFLQNFKNVFCLAFLVFEILAYKRTDKQIDRLGLLFLSRIYILYRVFYFLSPSDILSDESSMPFYSTRKGYNKEEAEWKRLLGGVNLTFQLILRASGLEQ